MDIYKKWVGRLIISAVGLLIIWCGISEWCVHRINEHYTENEIIALQCNTKSLYSTAITGYEAMKIPIGLAKKPDLVVLGSSRVMQFREAFFKDISFYNFGLSGSSLDDLNYAADSILAEHVPKTVIIGMDLWSLDYKWTNRTRHRINEKNILATRHHLYICLWKAMLNNPKVRQQVFESSIREYDVLGHRKTIGLGAAGDASSGFREDGSYQYGDLITEPTSYETKMAPTYDMITEEKEYFEYNGISSERIAKLETLLLKFKNRGCNVIVVLAPFPADTYKTLSGIEKYNNYMNDFVAAVNELCQKDSIACYNFLNPLSLGAETDEIIDGFHSSEKTYARMTLAMQSDEGLAKYINADYIEECLKNASNPYYVIPFEK